jgi:phage gp36-like protein
VAAYATAADLGTYALPAATVAALSSADKDAALLEASVYADGYLAAGRYVLPLTAWGVDLRRVVCVIAAHRLLSKLGFDSPDQGSSYRRTYDDAERWLRAIGDGKVIPADVTDSTPTVTEGGAAVTTDTRRGRL